MNLLNDPDEALAFIDVRSSKTKQNKTIQDENKQTNTQRRQFCWGQGACLKHPVVAGTSWSDSDCTSSLDLLFMLGRCWLTEHAQELSDIFSQTTWNTWSSGILREIDLKPPTSGSENRKPTKPNKQTNKKKTTKNQTKPKNPKAQTQVID